MLFKLSIFPSLFSAKKSFFLKRLLYASFFLSFFLPKEKEGCWRLYCSKVSFSPKGTFLATSSFTQGDLVSRQRKKEEEGKKSGQTLVTRLAKYSAQLARLTVDLSIQVFKTRAKSKLT